MELIKQQKTIVLSIEEIKELKKAANILRDGLTLFASFPPLEKDMVRLQCKETGTTAEIDLSCLFYAKIQMYAAIEELTETDEVVLKLKKYVEGLK